MGTEQFESWQGLSVIIARSSRMAAVLASAWAFPELRNKRTPRALDDAKDMLQVLLELYVLPTGRDDATRAVQVAGVAWLDGFEQAWNTQNQSFQSTECIRLLECFIVSEAIEEATFKQGLDFLLALKDAAYAELMDNADPAVQGLAQNAAHAPNN